MSRYLGIGNHLSQRNLRLNSIKIALLTANGLLLINNSTVQKHKQVHVYASHYVLYIMLRTPSVRPQFI